MKAKDYLNKLEVIKKKLDWANRYSDRLVKLSHRVFVLENSIANEREEYWNDEEYIDLRNFNKKIGFKIDVLARYGNIMTRGVFEQLKAK